MAPCKQVAKEEDSLQGRSYAPLVWPLIWDQYRRITKRGPMLQNPFKKLRAQGPPIGKPLDSRADGRRPQGPGCYVPNMPRVLDTSNRPRKDIQNYSGPCIYLYMYMYMHGNIYAHDPKFDSICCSAAQVEAGCQP